MIENNTKLNRKDIEFILNKTVINKPRTIFYRLFLLFSGMYFLFVCGRYLTAFVSLKKTNYLLGGVIFFIIGALLIYFIFGLKKYLMYVSMKRSNMDLERYYKIGKSVFVSMKSDDMNVENTFNFNAFVCYYHVNESIYIKTKINNSFIVLHDDKYSKGSYEELIKILENNNICLGK